MDEADKSRLLEEFRHYLDTLADREEESEEQTDLFSLFSELAALRTEVRTESRQFGLALNQFGETQALLRDSQASIERTLDGFRQELTSLRRAALRPLLIELLDLYDRLSAGQNALQNYRPVRGWIRIKSRREDLGFIQSVQQGQSMTLRRLEETLYRHWVRPIEALGQIVDPHTMTVIELDRQPELENGVVTAELRKGFLWGEEVLRLSEVKANKL